MRVRSLVFTSVALMALGTVSAAQGAGAASAEGAARHCVVDVSTPVAAVTCYDTFPVAIARATGGQVTDAPADVRKAVVDPAFEAELNAAAAQGRGSSRATTVVEISYEDSWFGGDTFTWTASRGCEDNTLGNVRFWVTNIEDYDSWWNDEIGSYRNYALCYSKHYEHAGFQGASLGWDYPERGDLGSLDDEISSIQWS